MRFDAGIWGVVEAAEIQRGDGWEAGAAAWGEPACRTTWVNRGKRGCARVRFLPEEPGPAPEKSPREDAARTAAQLELQKNSRP